MLKHITKIVTYNNWITGIIKIDKTYLKPPNYFHRINLMSGSDAAHASYVLCSGEFLDQN